MNVSYKYYTNGELADPHFTGLTVNKYAVGDDGEFIAVSRTPDGQAFLGYMAVEVSADEYAKWVEVIRDPDELKYFPGIFPGLGVLDKPTRKKLNAKIAAASEAYLKEQVDANRVKFKLAARDAKAIDEDHRAVFEANYPDVQRDIVDELFK